MSYDIKIIVLIISIITIIFLIYYLYRKYNHILYYNNHKYSVKLKSKESYEKIPKIIHQLAPQDVSKWPDTWIYCYHTWRKKYKKEDGYKYKIWTDEDLDEFMKNNYSFYYDIYKSYPKNIQRIDMARYFILYHYGGIYADMDYECNRYFMNNIEMKKLNIVESPYKFNENLHNSLMISPKGHKFWIHVINNAIKNKDIKDVLTSSGPRLLDTSYNSYNYKGDINVLNHRMYNPSVNEKYFKDNDIYTRHYLSSVWANRDSKLYSNFNKNK
jgi:mannosyltransferase OCH1-like enzyme